MRKMPATLVLMDFVLPLAMAVATPLASQGEFGGQSPKGNKKRERKRKHRKGT
jgi:hypothetical protein